MKSKQGGVKLSLIIVSIVVLGISAWFNQASADELHSEPHYQSK